MKYYADKKKREKKGLWPQWPLSLTVDSALKGEKTFGKSLPGRDFHGAPALPPT